MVTTNRWKIVSGSISLLLLRMVRRSWMVRGVEPLPTATVVTAKLIKSNILPARGCEVVAIGNMNLMVLVHASGGSL